MKKVFTVALLSLFAFPFFLFAQSLPDMKRQDQWGEKEKKAFLQHLRSGQPAQVAGQGKEVASMAKEEEPYEVHKAFYATLCAVSDTVATVDENDKLTSESTTFGPKLLVGGHLFSWIRYYTGIQYTRLNQRKKDNTVARLSHYQVPLGLELALIPLGTPHTRYVLLRGGVSSHFIDGPAEKDQFKTPILGLRGAWTLGLGYEWQIPDTNWRFHGLVEGYKTFSRTGGSRFYGAGATLGLVRTF